MGTLFSKKYIRQYTMIVGCLICCSALAGNACADSGYNYKQLDALTAMDKSVSRQYEDTVLSWGKTYKKEDTENKAHAVVNQASGIARLKLDMNTANQNVVAANQKVANLMAEVRQLEAQKAAMDAINPLGALPGGEAPGSSLIDAQIEQKLTEAKAAMAEAEGAMAIANGANNALREMEGALDPEMSASLYTEATKSGVTPATFDQAMADPTARAAVQKDLDNMYDKYLSDVPKVDLNTADGQAYAKSLLTALSGQTQAGGANNIPSEMLAGNAALAGYNTSKAQEQ